MVTSVQIVGISILKNTPELMAWLLGIVLGVIMVRRGGARAEKLFLAGCSLMFAIDLINPLVRELVVSNVSTGQTIRLALLAVAILSLVGLVCLVWAFWIRFWTKRQEAA